MEVLFLGGVFDMSHQDEIIRKTNTYVEYAANSFQMKLINGLKQNVDVVSVLSAPFLGAYPTAYKDWYFRGFESQEDRSGFQYVCFLNIWGIRNFSRTRALKKSINSFIEKNSEEKLIVVYTPHTPLVEAACYAKQVDPRIKICLVVPDLPQYMNLSSKGRWLYDILKKIDIKQFYKLNQQIDGYVILTKAMKDLLGVEERPYLVIEGLIGDGTLKISKRDRFSKERTIVYTGKLNEKFGVMNLIKAFKLINDESLNLIICGSGEQEESIRRQVELDSRIKYKGQVSMQEARNYINNATILVNPRHNDEEYTKYSFPSKIIDYLCSGNPVIAYKLDGMPDIYEEFLYIVEDNSIDALKNSIENVLNTPLEELEKKSVAAFNYLNLKRTPSAVTESILKLFEK